MTPLAKSKISFAQLQKNTTSAQNQEPALTPKGSWWLGNPNFVKVLYS